MNLLDHFIKPDYLTHSLTTTIKKALTFVAGDVSKLLHMPTNKTYIGIILTDKLKCSKIIRKNVLCYLAPRIIKVHKVPHTLMLYIVSSDIYCDLPETTLREYFSFGKNALLS